MSLNREQIEHLEHFWAKDTSKPWKNYSYSRKWLKRQMNKFIRLQTKKINEDSLGGKIGQKPMSGWKY